MPGNRNRAPSRLLVDAVEDPENYGGIAGLRCRECRGLIWDGHVVYWAVCHGNVVHGTGATRIRKDIRQPLCGECGPAVKDAIIGWQGIYRLGTILSRRVESALKS